VWCVHKLNLTTPYWRLNRNLFAPLLQPWIILIGNKSFYENCFSKTLINIIKININLKTIVSPLCINISWSENVFALSSWSFIFKFFSFRVTSFYCLDWKKQAIVFFNWFECKKRVQFEDLSHCTRLLKESFSWRYIIKRLRVASASAKKWKQWT